MNNFGKNLALWIVIGLLLVALFNLFQTSSTRGPQSTLAFSDFVADVGRGQVTDVTIQGNGISGHFTDGRAFSQALLLRRRHGYKGEIRAIDRLEADDKRPATGRRARIGR